MNTKNIHQTVTIDAPVGAVYKALTDSRLQSKITDSKAVIGRKVGSAFSVWGGGVNGITLLLAPNKRIVQAWRNEEWPAAHYSIVSFEFHRVGRATKLVFDQYGVPARALKGIAD